MGFRYQFRHQLGKKVGGLRHGLPPLLQDMHALRDESVGRIVLQGLFVGGGAGGVIALFRWVYEHSNTWLVALLGQMEHSPSIGAVVFLGLAVLALVVGLLLRAEPLISGSGIPQVELALSGRSPFPWLRIMVAKFIGTLVSLTGGLSVGREGPSIQMGAAVGCGFGLLFRRFVGENPIYAPRFLVAGSVAGMTAAFGAPLAGMFFAFEEVKTLLTAPHLLFTAVSALAAWTVVDVFLGFGLVFPFADIAALSWTQLWMALPMGLGAGVFGAIYNWMLLRVTHVHDRQTILAPWLKPFVPFMLSGVLFFFYPQVLVGFGVSVPTLAGLHGTLMPLSAILLLVSVKIFFSILSFASGVPGGLLMPMLYVGAMAGAVVGTLGLDAGVLSAQELPVALVLGMAGLFAATVRAPLTATVLVAEMCGVFHCVPEMLVVAFVATFTANKLGSIPVYDALKRRQYKAIRRAGLLGAASKKVRSEHSNS